MADAARASDTGQPGRVVEGLLTFPVVADGAYWNKHSLSVTFGYKGSGVGILLGQPLKSRVGAIEGIIDGAKSALVGHGQSVTG
ncbi:hypothetical protein ES703_105674 [subsurface metagenome]